MSEDPDDLHYALADGADDLREALRQIITVADSLQQAQDIATRALKDNNQHIDSLEDYWRD